MIVERTDARIDYLPNPRNEADENDLHVRNDRFLALGLEPITLGDGLMVEVTDIEALFPHPVVARAAAAAHKQHRA